VLGSHMDDEMDGDMSDRALDGIRWGIRVMESKALLPSRNLSCCECAHAACALMLCGGAHAEEMCVQGRRARALSLPPAPVRDRECLYRCRGASQIGGCYYVMEVLVDFA